MGTMTYDGVTVEFEDRLLTHLHIVIINHLRRHEGFAMSWKDANEVGDGCSSIWLDPSIPIYFHFAGSRVPDINEDWIERLSASADSSTGLIVTDESGDLGAASRPGVHHADRFRSQR